MRFGPFAPRHGHFALDCSSGLSGSVPSGGAAATDWAAQPGAACQESAGSLEPYGFDACGLYVCIFLLLLGIILSLYLYIYIYCIHIYIYIYVSDSFWDAAYAAKQKGPFANPALILLLSLGFLGSGESGRQQTH